MAISRAPRTNFLLALVFSGAVSIGLAFYPSSSSSAIGIMQFADHAMYAAKRAGGNQVSYSEPDLVLGRRIT